MRFIRPEELRLNVTHAIVGGESGPGARPMNEEWVISVRDQCRDHRVPFFFKQWGGVRKKKYGRELDGRTYDEYPKRVAAPVPDRPRCAKFAQETLTKLAEMLRRDALAQVTA